MVYLFVELTECVHDVVELVQSHGKLVSIVRNEPVIRCFAVLSLDSFDLIRLGNGTAVRFGWHGRS